MPHRNAQTDNLLLSMCHPAAGRTTKSCTVICGITLLSIIHVSLCQLAGARLPNPTAETSRSVEAQQAWAYPGLLVPF